MKDWFCKTNLFRLFRYTTFLNYLFLVFYTAYNSLHPRGRFFSLFQFRQIFDPSRFLNWVCYLLAILLIYLLFYVIYQRRIRARFSPPDAPPISYREGLQHFMSSSFLMNLSILLFFIFTYWTIGWMDRWFLREGMSQLDWLFVDPINTTPYKPGFYFAVLVASATLLFMLSIFARTIDRDHRTYTLLKVILLSSIIFFGIFSGLYSITNTIYNISIHNDINSWYSEDKQLGFFAIRISSLILFFHLIRFMVRYVFQSKLMEVLMLTFKPRSTLKTKTVALSDNEYSTVFFAQLGFYILNVSVAEISILFQGKQFFRTILDFALVFIIDDYMIIHEYAKKFKTILKWHKRRIFLFNTVLVITSFITLLQLNLVVYILVYLFVALILLNLAKSNRSDVVEV